MILFYKQDAKAFAAERIVLESAYPGEISFEKNITGKEQVIIASNIDDALEAVQQKPTARTILITDDKHALSPDEILDIANKGVSRIVNRGDLNDLGEKVSAAYIEKKNLNFYILQEEPELIIGKDHKLQLPGLTNNHIVGESQSVRNALHLLHTLLQFQEDILITGENGVGKGVFAKTFLDNAARKKQGVLNVAELSSELFASELFGYKKGSFTGADKDTEGMIAKHDKGILFLDEIGELRLEDQAKLLRVLQDREYRRVGDTEVRKFDIQFVFATNQDLESLIEKGKFREDLFHRISTLTVPIAPLRERKDDIPLLVAQRIDSLNAKYPEQAKSIEKKVVDMLTEQKWPGNIRMLEKFVTNLYVRETEKTITTATLFAYASELKSSHVNIESLKAISEKFDLKLDSSKATQELTQPASQSRGKSMNV